MGFGITSGGAASAQARRIALGKPLVDFRTEGSHTRASEASYRSALIGPTVISWAASGERRVNVYSFDGNHVGDYLGEDAVDQLEPNPEDLSVWTKVNGATAVGGYAAPDGDSDAYRIGDPGSSSSRIDGASFSVSGSTIYTCSVYVLKDENETRFPEFQLVLDVGATAAVQINTATGAFVKRAGGVSVGTITVVSWGDWWRLTYKYTTDSGTTSAFHRFFPALGATLGGVDSDATGEITCWGVNCTREDAPSSYVRGASRAADQLSFVLPAAMTNRRWSFEWIPAHGNKEPTGGVFHYIFRGASSSSQQYRWRPSSLNFEMLDSSGVVNVLAGQIGFSRHDKIKHTLEPLAGEIMIEGSSGVGNITYRGDPWEWAHGENFYVLNQGFSYSSLINNPVLAPNRPIVTFEEASFTRNSVAWYSTTPTLAVGSMVQAAVNEARIRTVEGKREYLSEVSRTQRIAGDSSRLGSASWSPTFATVDTEVVASVFEGELSDRLNFPDNSGARIATDVAGTTDGMTVVASVIARTESGTKDFRILVRRRDDTLVYSPDFTATTTPTLFYTTIDLLAGATAAQVRLINDAGGNEGSIIVDHVQVEDYGSLAPPDPALPSSPIRKTDGATTEVREADLMTFPELYAWARGLVHTRWRSEFASSISQNHIIWKSQSITAAIRILNNALYVRNSTGANTNLSTSAPSWNAGEALDIYLDFRDATNSAIKFHDQLAIGASENLIGGYIWGENEGGTFNGQNSLGTWLTEPRPGKKLV